MSPRHVPIVSGKEMVKVLERVGYRVVRQRGSHIRMRHSKKRSVSIPNHKELGVGLTLKILKDAEITVTEFKKIA